MNFPKADIHKADQTKKIKLSLVISLLRGLAYVAHDRVYGRTSMYLSPK